MFSVNGNEWTEFNIRTAVRSWRETRKNFGLFVTVEDEDGSLLPADQYLHAMNCSKWTGMLIKKSNIKFRLFKIILFYIYYAKCYQLENWALKSSLKDLAQPQNVLKYNSKL